MQLNAPQQQAVLQVGGPLLVFAGAGSGKTRVITYRIANLVASHHVPPFRVLAVTFTNKAAGEMKERLESLAYAGISNDLWVGTFHSVCCRLLRRYHSEVGLERSFVIYDDSDQKAMVTRIIRAMDVDERLFPPKPVLNRIHKQKQEGYRPSDIHPGPSFDETHIEIFDRYEKALRAANAVDFDDLILHMVRIAENTSSAAGSELRSRFDHLLVDEFQDTNSIQYRLIRALSAQSRNLCVVGDDDQSIYSWRGADIRNIRGFRKDFPDAAVIKLEQNYRSSGNIVAAALSVIQSAASREPKQLFTEAEAGALIRLRTVRDEREEAQFVVRNIRAEIAQGRSPEEIAVFYRVNAQSRVLEEAFRSEQLPYQIIGGMKFFDRAEVKDILAYLRLIDNPRSDADLLRIINTPARGIGNKTVERVLELAAKDGLCAYSAIEPLLQTRIGAASKKKLLAFRELIEELRKASEQLTPHELAEQVLERTGYRELLRNADNAEADARLENLEEFLGSLKEYEAEAENEGQTPELSGYLERVSLVADIDSAQGGPTVLLMTVHAAKGLEFESVYLTGMEEEMFPYRGLDSESVDELEEERRLAYVAITRAKQHLNISHASCRTIFGQTRYQVPSRFLRDLPDDLLLREGQQFSSPPHSRAYPGYPTYGHPRQPRAYDEFDQRSYDTPSAAAGAKRSTGYEASTQDDSAEERTIDYDAFDDLGDNPPLNAAVRRGAHVFHQRFGKGIVERVEPGDIPQIVARFPGFGSRKVLASYLRFE